MLLRQLSRMAALLLLSLLALQGYFALRVASMALVDPQSTAFQRSEAWRLAAGAERMAWRRHWVDYSAISPHLKRAVIASEDASFADHSGIEWEAIERAWERNLRAERANEQIERREMQRAARGLAIKAGNGAEARVVGGSTITQQLAKNLFLGGERSLPRKGQEFVITLLLEALLPKQRILEIYLNNVEWGDGLFGAQAAAQHYFRVDAGQLQPFQAARLAVMLPAPKRFQARPASSYVSGRAATIVARMRAVEPP